MRISTLIGEHKYEYFDKIEPKVCLWIVLVDPAYQPADFLGTSANLQSVMMELENH